MSNEEKYKTVEERAKEVDNYCNQQRRTKMDARMLIDRAEVRRQSSQRAMQSRLLESLLRRKGYKVVRITSEQLRRQDDIKPGGRHMEQWFEEAAETREARNQFITPNERNKQ